MNSPLALPLPLFPLTLSNALAARRASWVCRRPHPPRLVGLLTPSLLAAPHGAIDALTLRALWGCGRPHLPCPARRASWGCRRPRPPRLVELRTPSLAAGQEVISVECSGA